MIPITTGSPKSLQIFLNSPINNLMLQTPTTCATCLLPAPGLAPEVTSAATRCWARQPILDLKGRVVAYELLFRNVATSVFSGPGDIASEIMIDNTMIYGLSKLTAGVPAFINCTENTLESEYIQMLPAPLTVLEVLEDVEATDAVVKACRSLRRKGYKIALDDFDYRPSLDRLIRIADFIKIDFRSTPASRRRDLMASLREFKGTYLAEKVETREEYTDAREEGFSLFQGYYFCKPSLLRKKSVPSNRVVHLRLLSIIQEDPLDVVAIGALVKSEPALVYRLLRYVNSAAAGMADQITSVNAALLLAGSDLFRRMATLAVAVDLNSGHSPEILRMALVRARFCETASALCGMSSTEQYLVGLFSLLGAMLQMPMDEALAPLSLSAPIRAALLGTDEDLSCPIRWLEHHEHGDFDRCDALAGAHGFAPETLEECFNAATLWSDELLAEG